MDAHLPTLVYRINEKLTSPLRFEKELLSLNRVRNCLEHRRGIVGTRDVDPATRVLELSLPRLKVFYEANGNEVELEVGMVFEKETEVFMKRVTEQRIYRVGDRITFAADDFQEIGSACWFFVQDLGSKLPRLPQSKAA